MASEKILSDNGTINTESTAYLSEPEKAMPQKMDEGAIGEPDLDHEEVEGMDEGHLDDLERRYVCVSTHILQNADSDGNSPRLLSKPAHGD